MFGKTRRNGRRYLSAGPCHSCHGCDRGKKCNSPNIPDYSENNYENKLVNKFIKEGESAFYDTEENFSLRDYLKENHVPERSNLNFYSRN